MSSIPCLSFLNSSAKMISALVPLDSLIANNWNISLNGTDNNGLRVVPRYFIVDNTGNLGVVGVDFGVFQFTVPPYTRKTFKLIDNQTTLGVTTSTGVVYVSFFLNDPGIPDEVNQYQSSYAAATTGIGRNGFDPTKYNLAAALSNSNFTLTSPAAGGGAWAALSLDGKLAGKYYVEFTSNDVAGFAFGIGNNLASLTTNVGSTVNSVGAQNNGVTTTVRYNAGGIGAVTPYMGTKGKMAVDLLNKRIWFAAKGQVLWNAGNGDPANNLNGYDITTLIGTGTMFYIGSILTNSTLTTVNSGNTPFNDVVPSGFNAGW